MDDADIVTALRSRDEEAFRQLVEAWTPLMKRVARTYVSTDASAEEVVQDTWLGVLRGIDTFEGRASLKTWTFRILANIGRTRGARELRSVPAPLVDEPSPWPGPEQAALTADALGAVARSIGLLPARQRSVITLRDVHGFDSDVVCELLGLSPANQRVLLHRARAAVRAGLGLSYVEGPAA